MTEIKTLTCLRCKGRGWIPRDDLGSSQMVCPACNGEREAKYIEIDGKLYRITEAET